MQLSNGFCGISCTSSFENITYVDLRDLRNVQ
jgi:hypothetical protein